MAEVAKAKLLGVAPQDIVITVVSQDNAPVLIVRKRKPVRFIYVSFPHTCCSLDSMYTKPWVAGVVSQAADALSYGTG